MAKIHYSGRCLCGDVCIRPESHVHRAERTTWFEARKALPRSPALTDEVDHREAPA